MSSVHGMVRAIRLLTYAAGEASCCSRLRRVLSGILCALANAAVLKKKLCYICPECGTRWVHGYFNGREFLPDSEISIYRCLFERI